MATQNSTITVNGKLGNIVGYKGRDGKRLARIRQTEVKNPKTEAQVIQRMILATAAKAYARMKGIVDHSFQGVQYGGESQSYFLKRAMDDIRNWVAATLPITGEYPAELRDPLLYRGLAYPTDAHESGVGLLISEGTIPSVPAVLNTPAEGEDAAFDHFGALAGGKTVSDTMKALGAQVGDQITCVGLHSNGVLYASRYVIKADATAEDLGDDWVSDGDSSAFDTVKTSIGRVRIQTDGSKIIVVDSEKPAGSTFGLDAAAIIISRKAGDTWQRSTQRLVWLLDAGDYTGTDIVVSYWLAGTAQVDTVNPRYLNQAEQAGE